MEIKIALAGNPNCGKTTLFNALTGSNQFVGNWPGVTVEKKEGKLKSDKNVVIQDLPGIYSLSPYTLEEVVSRTYLVTEKPDAILNIVDGTNIERNLYLTTQLIELGLPVIMAVNMMDLVRKNGDQIDLEKLGAAMGCQVASISALKNEGTDEAIKLAVAAAKAHKAVELPHVFTGSVEHAIAHIEESIEGKVDASFLRWYAIKVFERDAKVLEELNLSEELKNHIEQHIVDCEKEMDDDAESIITNQRYAYINGVVNKAVVKKPVKENLTTSDKVDKIVTNRILALPIFAVVMWLVYFLSIGWIGDIGCSWVNDGVFGDGWHLVGIGSGEFEEADGEYADALNAVSAFYDIDVESEDFDAETALAEMTALAESYDGDEVAAFTVEDEETLETIEMSAYFHEVPADADEEEVLGVSYVDAVDYFAENGFDGVDPAEYGIWVPGIPVLLGDLLDSLNCVDWLEGLILDGIVAGVGAVLGFLPQMLVLFICLAILEDCGYMARIAFIMDRIFRRFGLSGKSFIPIMIGMGCGVPGIMGSRTIENDRDRRMTVMVTTFIPCGAKLPFIAMIAGAIFGGSVWVAYSSYLLGILAIICSGIILKKTRLFAGDPAPFVMELPAYHFPTVVNVLRSMWERGWAFVKKAGTIILLSTIIVWFGSFFGFVDGAFQMLAEDQLDNSLLAMLGNAIAWIFIPQGFGTWQATVASITGLVAKENIVGTLGILYGSGEATVYQAMGAAFTSVSGYAFLAFNLLCAPCFAAIGAIKREMNSTKWFWTAIGYQCGLAYLVALVVNQLGGLIAGTVGFNVFTVVAIALVIGFIYLLFRPAKTAVKSK